MAACCVGQRCMLSKTMTAACMLFVTQSPDDCLSSCKHELSTACRQPHVLLQHTCTGPVPDLLLSSGFACADTVYLLNIMLTTVQPVMFTWL